MNPPQDEPKTDLGSYLAELEDQLAVVSETGFALDPEDLTARLDHDARLIEDTVDAVLAEAEIDLLHVNDLVHHATREMLMAATFPFVLKTTTDPDVPELETRYWRASLAALLRAMQIVADCSGPDCELHVTTGTDGAAATISIRSDRPGNASGLPLEFRTSTLAALLHEIGGGFSLRQDGDAAELTLRLQTKRSPV